MASQWSPGGGGRPNFCKPSRTPEKNASYVPSGDVQPFEVTIRVRKSLKFLEVCNEYQSPSPLYSAYQAVMSKTARDGLLTLQVRLRLCVRDALHVS